MSWLSFLKGKKHTNAHATPIFFTNTLTKEKERFVSHKPDIATLYSCGPTVYSRQHIGNLRATVFADTLARVLMDAGYRVRRVINITDVGHLTSDADEGEDKIELGAKREGISASAIAERYTSLFLHDLQELHIDTHGILFPRATDYIKEQISLAETLEEKGFAYRITDGLYFDTSKFAGYGKLGGVIDVVQKAGARVARNTEKRHPADFALWKTTPKGVHRLQEWDSPWGRGCPGWHIECSAMARTLLGVEIDLHTGGEEHVAVHHNNEIAQSEASSGRPFAHYWLHNAHLTFGGKKLSKSTGDTIYLSDITERGFHPLALRYFFHQAHYRTPLSFSWEALESAAEGLNRLWKLAHDLKEESRERTAPSAERMRFITAMHDDLNTPQALGILWDALRNEDLSPSEKWGLVVDADTLLGLMLVHPPALQTPLDRADLPASIQQTISHRDAARAAKDFATADALRDELTHLGYRVEDGTDGTILYKE